MISAVQMIRFQFFLLLTLAFASPAFAAPEIVDGDTLRIDGQRVRLWGFDAPEKHQSCRIDGVERPIGEDAVDPRPRQAGMSARGTGTDTAGRSRNAGLGHRVSAT